MHRAPRLLQLVFACLALPAAPAIAAEPEAMPPPAAASEPPAAASAPRARPLELRLGLMGGAAVGVASPLWAGAELELEGRFAKRLVGGGRLKVTAGSDGEGGPLGGYRLNAFVGFDWFASRYESWKWLLHGGVMSLAWVPSPNLGIDSQLSFSPLSFEHFRWSLGWDGTAEFPWRASTSMWTELTLLFDGFSVGVQGSVGLHGGVDLVGVGAGLSLQLGWRF